MNWRRGMIARESI